MEVKDQITGPAKQALGILMFVLLDKQDDSMALKDTSCKVKGLASSHMLVNFFNISA